MNSRFEIAPPHGYDWDKALAFAFTPAITAAIAVYWFQQNISIAVGVGLVGFFGTLVCALLLARPSCGSITLTDTFVEIDSLWLHTRIPLDTIDLAAASLTPARNGGCTVTLITDPAKTVTMPLWENGSISVSPTEPAELIEALHAIAAKHVPVAA